jgi:cell division protein FtsI (penicillin-binding protein 3)
MKPATDRRVTFLRARIVLLGTLLLAGAGAVLYRAFDLQVRQGPALREMAEEQYLKDIHLAPKRGTIFDRNGAELAISVEMDSVYANPVRLRADQRDPGQLALALSELLGVDRKTMEERLGSDKRFVWVKRRVSPKESKAIKLLAVPGIELTSEPRRYYPNRELAAHLLGFSNIDGQGVEGLERKLDEQLRGSSERVPAVRDRRGVVVFSEQLLDERSARGDDVTLTIDKTIQHVAERELELAVRTFEAKAGSVVVMDPRTGELLAVANFPTFNPNSPASDPPSHRRNRAATDRFEPGSTLKPFTLAGALRAGAMRADERIDCQHGALEVAEYTIHDTHQWDVLSLGEVLEYSSNIGAAKVGLALGRARLYRALRDFGFGSATALDLPGETSGILRHYKRWYDMDAATIAFGQGMSATALQLTVAMGALANQGKLMRPTIVKRIEDAAGVPVLDAVPRVERQVVSPYVASVLTDMMIAVTGENGTGYEAALPGQLVAGKTGTAQKADYVHGGYADGRWVSSFVGFAPARRPRVVIGVIVDEPMIAHQGGAVAAPAFRRIAEATLRHLGVVGDDPTVGDELRAHKPAQKAADAKLAAAASATDQQEPLAASTPEAPSEPIARDQRRVPELLGQTARAAIVGAQHADLQLSLSGSGLVRTQQPEAGAVVAAGSIVTVVLEPPDNGNSPAPVTQGAGEGRPPAEAASIDPADVDLEPQLAPARAAAEPARAREKRAPRPRAAVVARSEGRDG